MNSKTKTRSAVLNGGPLHGETWEDDNWPFRVWNPDGSGMLGLYVGPERAGDMAHWSQFVDLADQIR